MARTPNFLPLSFTFIQLIVIALTLDPARNARGEGLRSGSEYIREGFLPSPERSSRQGEHELGREDEEEIHRESRPDHEPGLAVAVHFADAVIEYVRDREYDDRPGKDAPVPYLEYLDCE